MENRKEEQMIYFKDLIFTALRRWRAVLAVALILGLLLGGMQGVKGLSALKTPVDPVAQQEALEQYEAEKLAHEQLVTLAQNNIDNYQTYLADALLMQLDPYCHYEATLSVFVQTAFQIQPGMSYQNPDRTADILSAYETVMSGDAAMQAMAEALETEPQYLFELLSAKKTDKTGTLILRVKLPTQEAAEKLLPVLEAQITGAYEQVETAVEKHTVTVVEQSVAARVDTVVADDQQKRQERLSALEKALTDAQTALAKVVPPAVGQTGSFKSVVKKAVIFAVLGAVLGAFLVVCVLWVLHITSDKVYGVRSLQGRTGIKVIGTLGCEKKNPIDRFLYRLEGRSMDDLQTSPVAVDIGCRAKDAKSLLITGSGDAADRETLVKAVSAAVPGVRVADCGSILRSAAALEALADCDAVVLVETSGVSRYSAVNRQKNVIGDYGAVLLGCVLLEK